MEAAFGPLPAVNGTLCTPARAGLLGPSFHAPAVIITLVHREMALSQPRGTARLRATLTWWISPSVPNGQTRHIFSPSTNGETGSRRPKVTRNSNRVTAESLLLTVDTGSGCRRDRLRQAPRITQHTRARARLLLCGCPQLSEGRCDVPGCLQSHNVCGPCGGQV